MGRTHVVISTLQIRKPSLERWRDCSEFPHQVDGEQLWAASLLSVAPGTGFGPVVLSLGCTVQSPAEV